MAGKKIYEDTKKVLENILSEIESIKGKTLLIGFAVQVKFPDQKLVPAGDSNAAEQMGEVFFEYSEKYGFNFSVPML